MTSLSPTAPRALDAGVVSLATGDVRVPVFGDRYGDPRQLASEQAYPPVAGAEELRVAVAGASGVAADDVVVSPGARLAIHAVLCAAVGPRRTVLLPSPHWPSYPHLVRLAGGVPVVLPGEPGDGRVDVDALDAHRDAAVVVVNSPRNPDGAVTPAGDLRRVAEWAADAGAVVLFDEVYRRVPLWGRTAPSALDVLPTLPPHCVVVDGLTKSHALAGLRLGWAVARPPLRDAITGIASHLFGGVSAPAQALGARVLAGGDDVARAAAAVVGANADAAVAVLSALPGVRCDRPQGGIFLFPDLSEWLRDGAPDAARTDLSGWLLDVARVAVVDGAPFGFPGRVRMSAAVPQESMAEGIARLRAALSADAGTERG